MNVKTLQRKLNAFDKRFRLKHKPLLVDGKMGRNTKNAVKRTKYYMGYAHPYNNEPGAEFYWRLEHPRTVSKKFNITRAGMRRGVARRSKRRRALHAVQWDWAWAGSRGVTNEVIRIVNGRAPITSRKRWELFNNPSSDHYMLNRTADAVDFGTASNYELANEIARKLGGSWSGDYDSFIITRKGKQFRVQIIAGTHGTGPHLHVGVRRV